MKADREYDIRCREVLHVLLERASRGFVEVRGVNGDIGSLTLVWPEGHEHLDLLDRDEGIEDVVKKLGRALGAT